MSRSAACECDVSVISESRISVSFLRYAQAPNRASVSRGVSEKGPGRGPALQRVTRQVNSSRSVPLTCTASKLVQLSPASRPTAWLYCGCTVASRIPGK